MVILLFGLLVFNHDDLGEESETEELVHGTSHLDGNIESILSLTATKGEELFSKNCNSCHRLDLKIIGPPLRDIFERRDSIWILQMIVNADMLIKNDDKEAISLSKEFGGRKHPAFESLTRDELYALIEYLKLKQGPIP